MLPSSEQVAENVRRHCEGMADEIARRVNDESQPDYEELSERELQRVYRHALTVLLDWFLGDWFPGKEEVKLPVDGDSNTPPQGGWQRE